MSPNVVCVSTHLVIQTEPIVRRGRPREFDRDVALKRAMMIFWEKGFEATSMSDLVEAMKINSPSIYRAFGSKEDLFRRRSPSTPTPREE